MECNTYKIEVLIPERYIASLRNRLNEAGILTVGKYDNVISYSEVKGYWRTLEGSDPYDGEAGTLSEGTECKMEFRCRLQQIDAALMIIKAIHPYEEPIVNIIPLLCFDISKDNRYY
ncbi:cytochrome C biogenesis protein [Sporolactobacillus shoreicorticis]|uniref:Cytochrome C biogenesis protein n=1 Tax=Sporolactobacillus shoreicorticis TaxID=1923877 RepID=A0ABW5S1H9_9BACL|nr:cytochrome C biogenesis protein [Sporolactobacillus shoreicorticis]MCO7126489.1 cytochrome C biogenesis protein [Sporolactobacillus shoreicorticis]